MIFEWYPMCGLIASALAFAVLRIIDVLLRQTRTGWTSRKDPKTPCCSLDEIYTVSLGGSQEAAFNSLLTYCLNYAGPVVRVSPFEIAINDPDGVKTIQKVSGGFDKGPWYDSTGPGLLGMRDHVKHSRQRRLLAHPLINTSLMSFEPLVQAKINLAMDQIERECARIGVSDIYKWFSLMTTDIIGDLTFGSSFRMFERGEKDQYVLDLQSIMTDVHVRAELSPFINVLFYLPLPQAKEIQNRLGRIIEYGRQSMNRLRTAIETGSLKTPIFFSMIMDPKDTENSLTELEMQEEAAEFMITGTNTTSNTLTYLVWAILKHPQIRKRLEKEVAELSHNYTDSEGVREFVLAFILLTWSSVDTGCFLSKIP